MNHLKTQAIEHLKVDEFTNKSTVLPKWKRERVSELNRSSYHQLSHND